jgi:hypothetical protein
LSKSPADVIKSLPEPKVLERLDTFCEMYRVHFQSRYSGIHLNVKLLRHAVESCFLDLERMKAFHGIDYADQHKRAAFAMHWITKTHPIQLATDANMTEALLVINEWFAIHAGLAHLDIDVSDISGPYLRNLIYILHFRQPSPEILASAMYLLECSCCCKTP